MKLNKQLAKGSVSKGMKVDEVEKAGDRYLLKLNNGEEIFADSVIVTTPHHAVQAMFNHFGFFDPLKKMPATSVATIAMAFPEEAIEKDIDGTGFVVSRNSDYTITACTWAHKKWPHTTPEGKVLLRCYVEEQGMKQL